MSGWQRPYSLDAVTGFGVLALLKVAGIATVLVIVYVRGQLPTLLAVPVFVWLAAVLTVLARRAMLGVYVSDIGVRSRSLLRTTTVPWASVAGIHSGTATFAGLDMGRLAIVIERTDGPTVQTPLQRGDLFRPFTFRPELGRLATWPEHYDEILEILRAHHREAQRRVAGTPTGHRDAEPGGGSDWLELPSTGSRRTGPSTGAGRGRAARDAATADRRRDLHALARQHQRGALTDAEYAAALARIQGSDQVDGRRGEGASDGGSGEESRVPAPQPPQVLP